jgi:hypothetical protein
MRGVCVTKVIPPLTDVTQGSTHTNSATNWRQLQGNRIRRMQSGLHIKLRYDVAVGVTKLN